MDREGAGVAAALPRVVRIVAILILALSAGDMARRAWLRAAERPLSARLDALTMDEDVALERKAGPALAVARAVHRFVPDASHLIVSHDGTRESSLLSAFLPALVFPRPPRVYDAVRPIDDRALFGGLEGTICLAQLQTATPFPIADGFVLVTQLAGCDLYVWTGP